MDHLDTDLIADTMPGYNATSKGRRCMPLPI